MVGLKFKFDTQQLKEAAAVIIQRTENDTVPKLLEHLGKLAVQHLIRLTPPLGGTWPKQKQKGERAVARDINKIFGELGRFRITDPKLDKAWRKALRTRDIPAMEALARQIGLEFKAIALEVNESDHQSQRNRRGIVPGKWRAIRQILVIRGASVGQYIRKVQKRVGFSKWGWGNAAKKLGATGLPKWVTGHAPGGNLQRRGKGTAKQQLKLQSDRKAGWGNPDHLVKVALSIVRRNMVLQAKNLLAKDLKKK